MTISKHRPNGRREYTRRFTQEELRHAYLGLRLSIREIALKFQSDRATVARALREAGITIERRSREAMLRFYTDPANRPKPVARSVEEREASAGRRRTYASWFAMKARCYDANDRHFKRYGARGIRVCDRWIGSFEAFLIDMGPRPPGMTIERRDNDGNYEPSNCVWATRLVQQNNRHNNFVVVLHGERLTLSQLARRTGLGLYGLRSRLVKGMPIEMAVTKPMRKARVRRRLTIAEEQSIPRRLANGETRQQIADQLGCHNSHICRTLQKMRAER